MRAAGTGHTEIVRLLIDKGADVNLLDKNGETALMGAAGAGHTEIVKVLIDKKANVDTKNNNGVTALIKAAEKKTTL